VLLGYWPLNNHALDKSGHGNNGVVSGMTYASGPFGHSVGSFDGNDDNVNLGDVTALNSVSQFTIAMWLNQDVLNEPDVAFLKLNGNARVQFSVTSPNMLLYVSDGSLERGFFNYGSIMPAETWNHLVVVYDGSQADNATRLKAYVNAEPVTLSFSGTIPATTGDLTGVDATIGYTSSSWDGLIGDTRIYNVALTGDEVAALHRSER
jgi:hypothetical protein